jgi:hypothetical protein
MNNFLKLKRRWRDSTKIKSNRCVNLMNLKWKEEDKITVTSKKLILRDSMNFKLKRMKNQESLKKGLMS